MNATGRFTLVFETSTPHASIALIAPDGSAKVENFQSDRHHNAALFPYLSELLCDVAAEKIGLVLVGSGPGSYSGTRVGIAAAQGVALAASGSCVAVPSILAVPSATFGKCLAVGDARRGTWWIAEMEEGKLKVPPTLFEEAEFSQAISSALASNVPVISFDETTRFPLAESAKIRKEMPAATRLYHAWLAAGDEIRENWQREIPQPIYLKPPHITPGKKRSWV